MLVAVVFFANIAYAAENCQSCTYAGKDWCEDGLCDPGILTPCVSFTLTTGKDCLQFHQSTTCDNIASAIASTAAATYSHTVTLAAGEACTFQLNNQVATTFAAKYAPNGKLYVDQTASPDFVDVKSFNSEVVSTIFPGGLYVALRNYGTSGSVDFVLSGTKPYSPPSNNTNDASFLKPTIALVLLLISQFY